MVWETLVVEIILTLTAMVVALLPAENQRQIRVSWGLTILGLCLGVIATWQMPVGGTFWGGFLTLDGLAHLFRLLILVGSFMVVLFSREFLLRRDVPVPEFYALLLFSTLGMELVASTTHFLLMYLGLEIMGISGYALAGLLKNDPRGSEAALKYFFMGALASAVFLLGAVLIYGQTGSLDLVLTSRRLTQYGIGMELVAAMVFLLAGLGFKVAVAPFHMWAPDTYEGALAPVTAFFSVGPKAAGFAALLRVMAMGLGGLSAAWRPLAAGIAILTMTLGNLSALHQTNVKRMMAYSSIAQAGYILVGLAVGTGHAYAAMLFYLVAYAFMNLGAFAVITLVSAEEGREELEAYNGLARRHPVYAAALTLFFLSLIGIPPTAGFLGKMYLFGSAIEEGYPWLAVIMVLNGVLSVPYYYEVVRRMYFLPGEAVGTGLSTWLKSWTTTLAVGVAVLVTLGLVLVANPMLTLVLRLGGEL